MAVPPPRRFAVPGPANDLRVLRAALWHPERGLSRLRRSVLLTQGARDNAYDELLACHQRAAEREAAGQAARTIVSSS